MLSSTHTPLIISNWPQILQNLERGWFPGMIKNKQDLSKRIPFPN